MYKNYNKRSKKVQYLFRSNKDSFVEFFYDVGKIMDFCNKKYNIRCRKIQTSKYNFLIQDVGTNKIVGTISPINCLRKVYSTK